MQAEIRGRDLVSGLPKTVVLTSEEVRAALEEPLVQIIDAIKETLDRTPPELASDIMDRGIMLAGGGSLLQGLDERLREETQMPAHRAESPLTCVAVGSGRSLEEFEAIHRSNRNATATGGRAQAMMHDKVVRRRRAVLAVLVLLSLFLLTAYFGECSGGGPARRPARRDGGPRADPGGRQPGAQAVPRPVRLVRRHARRQGRARQAQDRARRSCASRSPPSTRRNARSSSTRACRSRTSRAASATTSPVPARVIARSPNSWYQTFQINKGSSDGVRVDQPVVNGAGLVGKVKSVSDGNAVGDAAHRPGVRRLRPGAASAEPGSVGPAVGAPGDLRFELVPNAKEVRRAIGSSPRARARRAA